MKSIYSFRDPFDADRNEEERELSAYRPVGPSLTKPEFAEQADINVLVSRFGLGNGTLPPPPNDPRYYGDVTLLPGSLREILDITRDAEAKFMALPPEVRRRFHNDAVEFLEFVNGEDNIEEARRLGLLAEPEPAPVEPAPIKVIVTSSEPPSPAPSGK